MSRSIRFKQTELGEIPEEWEVKRLGEVANIFDHLRIPLSEKQRESMKGKYPYCGANGVIDYINDYIFDGEYVLLAEDGGYWGAFEPSAYIMQGKFWVNNHAHVLQGKDGILLNRFLVYTLNFFDLTGYVSGTTRGKLTQTEMKKIPIPLPPLEEQKRIAGVLRLVDEIIDRTRKIVELYEKAKKYALSHLLTKGIGHTRFKQTELGEIPEEWEIVKVNQTFEDISASVVKVKKRDCKSSGKYPVVDQGREFIAGYTDQEGACFQLPVIVFGDHTRIFKFIDFPFVRGADGVKVLKPKTEIDPHFLYYAFTSLQLPTIGYQRHYAVLCEQTIPLPPLEEQKQIAEILSTIDKAIDNERRYLEALGKLKKWLLNNLLTGKVRLPEWVGDVLKQVFLGR